MTDAERRARKQKPLVIDRQTYVIARVLLSLNKLQKAGYVTEGGPEINHAALTAIKNLGEALGWEDPSEEELKAVTLYFAKGGGWERGVGLS